MKAHTTTDCPRAEIHALGMEELERLQETTSEKLRAAGYGGGSFSARFEAFNATSVSISLVKGWGATVCSSVSKNHP